MGKGEIFIAFPPSSPRLGKNDLDISGTIDRSIENRGWIIDAMVLDETIK